MSPASHSGLIYYSETLKYLTREKKYYPYSQGQRKHSRMLSVSKQDHTNAGPTESVLILYTMHLHTHTEGADGEPSDECHTWKESNRESITKSGS